MDIEAKENIVLELKLSLNSKEFIHAETWFNRDEVKKESFQKNRMLI